MNLEVEQKEKPKAKKEPKPKKMKADTEMNVANQKATRGSRGDKSSDNHPYYTKALITSLLSTCCCLPMGIVSLIMVVKGNKAFQQHFDALAEGYFNSSRLVRIAVLITVIIVIIAIAAQVITGAMFVANVLDQLKNAGVNLNT